MTKEAQPNHHAMFFQTPIALAPKTQHLVAEFAQALAGKLYEAQTKYLVWDSWADGGWRADCQTKLLAHVLKGDPRDVAAYAAFCWFHKWPTAPAEARETFEAYEKMKRERERLIEALAAICGSMDRKELDGMIVTLAAVCEAVADDDDEESEGARAALKGAETLRDILFGAAT